jgi:Type II CAAX prenyl endopeptidase Rce1-like
MNIVKKTHFFISALIVLIIPVVFGFKSQNLIQFSVNFIQLVALIGIGIAYYLIGVLIFRHQNEEVLQVLKKNEIFKGMQEGKWINTIFVFAVVMLFEELIFRFYLIALLEYSILENNLIILIGSLIFGIYHIHIYFQYKNKNLAVIYIVFSFCLGIYFSVIFFLLGIFGSFLAHFLIVFFIYYTIWRKSMEKT